MRGQGLSFCRTRDRGILILPDSAGCEDTTDLAAPMTDSEQFSQNSSQSDLDPARCAY